MRKNNSLSESSCNIIQQLNRFRINPESIHKHLQERKKFINHNNLLFSPNHPNKSIKTKQGTSAVNELIGQLFNERHLQPIKQNDFLSECAALIAFRYKQENIDEQVFVKKISNQIRARINQSYKYLFNSPVKCLIGVSFKQQNEPFLTMLIDDGDTFKTKRKVLLSNDFKYCGASSVELSDSSLVCGVYLFTNDVQNR